MQKEINAINRLLSYWEDKGYKVGWMNSNATLIRWYASYVYSGRPNGVKGFNNGLRKALKASLLTIIPRTTKSIIAIKNNQGIIGDGTVRKSGTGLTFTLEEGKRKVRLLNDHARLHDLNYRYKLAGNQKVRKRGLRYISRYEIEYQQMPEFISIDSFDEGSAGFDEWSYKH